MKAILVIDDMPKNCAECKLMYLQGIGEGICNSVDWEERPSWCPLKPMPKEEDIYEVGMDEEDTNAKRQWNKGWNACLKEIDE